MAAEKTIAAKLEKHLPSIRKNFRKVLKEHGLGDLHVSHFQLAAAADDAHDCGYWEDKCVNQDGHIVCGPVWVSKPC